MKKRKIILLVFLALLFNLLLVLLFSLQLVLSLGISPAIHYVDFEPNMELEYNFKIYANPDQEIELYAAEEFSDLVEFNKKELMGGGGFSVKIKLPDKIEKPGKHRILIGAREKIGAGEGAVGTSVAVQAPIIITVPYPGKYAEIGLHLHNANVGEKIKMEIKVSSLGKEPITATADIDIFSRDNKIETLNLGTKVIENQKKDSFVTFLDTSDYRAGDYRAIAIVNYQVGIAKAESVFRIGTLFVNITNYTREIVKGGIKSFDIFIESLWNDPLENVYSEVYISKDNINFTDFLTPSVDLEGWKKKKLLGYIDTDKLEPGKYDAKMKLIYGKNHTIVDGELKIVREKDYLVYYIAGGILLLIILVIVYIKFGKKVFKKK